MQKSCAATEGQPVGDMRPGFTGFPAIHTVKAASCSGPERTSLLRHAARLDGRECVRIAVRTSYAIGVNLHADHSPGPCGAGSAFCSYTT